MSLILGINLPKYLYLVCDTRLTTRYGEKVEYKDNFCKFYSYNENVSAVVAGNANFAAYILREINKLDFIKEGFVSFENKIEEAIKSIVSEYVMTGIELSHNSKPISVFLIFAGFDKSFKKQVNSSQYGNTLANTFVKGQGQTINRDIIQKMTELAIKNGGNGENGAIGMIGKDTIVELDDPYSSIITIEIVLPNTLIIKKVDCYKYVMKAPKKLTEEVLPTELAYKLEHNQTNKKWDDLLGSQAVLLNVWVNEVIKQNGLETVGGDILPNMITSEGAIIMTGTVNFLNKETGEIGVISEIMVEEGKFCVRDRKTGKVLPLENIYDYNGDGGGELMF